MFANIKAIKSTCQDCGREIVFDGDMWHHLGIDQPRHPPTPTESQMLDYLISYIKRLKGDS